MTPDDQKTSILEHIRHGLEVVAICLTTCLGLGLLTSVIMAALGIWPWLSLPAHVGANAIDAGPILQIGLCVVLATILAMLPASARVMRLERVHRSFQIDMNDVTRAYYAAHAADRAGVFQMHREFDAMRERMDFLTTHPDLGSLDPEILELAAQMSTEARDLAGIYSDERVAHARSMLAERHGEAERLDRLIDRAHVVTRDIRRTLEDVTLKEDTIRSRVAMLRDELETLWPEITEGAPPPHPTLKLRLAAE
ncbi:MAG: DNA repair protein [Pseudomonadota bacterium]